MIVFRVSGFIMDPVMSTFPKILSTSDVMDALKVNHVIIT